MGMLLYDCVFILKNGYFVRTPPSFKGFKK